MIQHGDVPAPMIVPTALRTLLLAPVLVILGAGCGTFGWRFQSPIVKDQKEARFGPGKMTAAAVQSEVMSFADTFNSTVAEQWNRVEADARAILSVPDDELSDADRASASRIRRSALENKLATVSASLSIASSPNPTVALADMITMVTLQRMVVESPEAIERLGEHAEAMAEFYRVQEDKIWRIGKRAMSPKQQEELTTLIAQWREENPDTLYVANVRLEDFAHNRQQAIVDSKRSGDSLLTLVALDPLAGLEPAQREVLMSRMFAERVFFYGTRMPQVLKWQAESLSQSVLRAPELMQANGSLSRFSESAERLAAIAEQLPETQARLQGTLSEFREILDATRETAGSLTTTIHAADSFAARFDDESNEDESEPDRNVLLEYQAAVAETGDAAEDLTVFAEKLDGLLEPSPSNGEPGRLQSAVSDVQSSAKSVINYAFVRLLALVIVLPLAIALAVGLYRRMVRRQSTRTIPGSSYG